MRHLDLLNAFLGLRFRQPGFPTCLADCGYTLHAIGVTFRTAAGEKVAPDVLTSQLDRQLTLLVEVKGGHHADRDQLRRLRSVTPADLRDYAHLRIRDADAHRVHVVYWCNEQDRDDLVTQLDSEVTVIGYDGRRIRISGAPLPDEHLASALQVSRVEPDTIPQEVIPFDRESSDDEVARVILPYLVDLWLSGVGSIQPAHLVSKTHYLVGGIMASTGSGSELHDIENKVKSVLSAMARDEVSDWLEYARSSPSSFHFRLSPPTDADRVKVLDRVQKAANAYLERVSGTQQLTIPFSEDV